MATSPKASTMPGGAPLKARSSKRPCKYGPRDSDGRCPKKPKSASARSKSASGKRPCKYGPRGADGLCPKKPKSQRAPSVRDYESVSRAAQQAGQVLRSSKATKEQKHEAVKVLGGAIAQESGKKIVEHTVREARKALKTPKGRAAAVKVAKSAAKAAKAVGTATAIGAVLAIGGAALDANREREAQAYADRELAATRKRLKGGLTPQQAATLRQQYVDFFKKQPTQNPFLGK